MDKTCLHKLLQTVHMNVYKYAVTNVYYIVFNISNIVELIRSHMLYIPILYILISYLPILYLPEKKKMNVFLFL